MGRDVEDHGRDEEEERKRSDQGPRPRSGAAGDHAGDRDHHQYDRNQGQKRSDETHGTE